MLGSQRGKTRIVVTIEKHDETCIPSVAAKVRFLSQANLFDQGKNYLYQNTCLGVDVKQFVMNKT